MDVRCGCRDTLFGGRELVLAEIVQLEQTGDPWDAMHAFCRLMCPNPVLAEDFVFGGDDWYAYYSNNSFEGILKHAKRLADCAEGLGNRPYQMIDAGWQLCHNWYPGDEYIGGPYRYCNSKFKDMKALATAIRDLGVRPGIWCRPLETVEYVSKEAFTHRVKNVKYLDPSHPEARELHLQFPFRKRCLRLRSATPSRRRSALPPFRIRRPVQSTGTRRARRVVGRRLTALRNLTGD